MAWHIEKGTGDIVINGFEKGVAPSPYQGIGNLKNINISTIPGEAMVNYARTSVIQTAISGGTISNSASSVNQLGYVGSTPLIPGNWVLVAGGSTISNFTNSTGNNSTGYFFVKDLISGSTTNGQFSFSLTYGGAAITNFGTSGTATFSTFNVANSSITTTNNLFIGSCTEFVSVSTGFRYYMVDSVGHVWQYPYAYNGGNSWGMIGPPNESNRANSGIFTFYGYLFRASDGSGGSGGITSFEYKPTNSLGTLWTTFSHGNMNNQGVPHTCIVGVQDNTAWICDGQYINQLEQAAGKTFDPTDTSTFGSTAFSNGVFTSGTLGSKAIILYNYETAQCLAELGTSLVIGGTSSNLYLFDRGVYSTIPALTIIPLVEGNVKNAVTAGNVVYLFIGSKGHIYVTSGAIVSPILSIPDYVTGQIEPYYIFGGATFLRGRIFFSFQDSNSSAGGIWSFTPVQGAFIEQDIGNTLRLENISSFGTYAGYASVIIPVAGTTGQNAQGPQYYSAVFDGILGYGIDASSTTPYTGGQSIIESDFIPIGTFLDKGTFKNIEYKLSTPLVSGESITLKVRGNLTSSFSALPTNITENDVSGYTIVNFESGQWVQVQAILTSTASTPSYCRLVELRIR